MVGSSPPRTEREASGPNFLIVTKELLRQLLGDPTFFAACPEFRGFGVYTVPAYQVMLSELSTNQCCGPGSKTIDGYRNSFVEVVSNASPEVRERVRLFIQGKIGYPVDGCAILYRKNGKHLKVTF